MFVALRGDAEQELKTKNYVLGNHFGPFVLQIIPSSKSDA